MTIIKRSPYTFKVKNDSMRLTLSTDVLEPGSVEWPVYEVDGKYYLQERFDLVVPKGISVVKIVADTFRGVQVTKTTITDEDKNIEWFKNKLSTTPVYRRIAVSQNAIYKLKVDDMSQINYEKGALRFEWSYSINKETVDLEDYKDDEIDENE